MRLNKYTLKIENGEKTILYNLVSKMLLEVDYHIKDFDIHFFKDIKNEEETIKELKNKLIISEDNNDDFAELMRIKEYYNNSSIIGRFVIHLGYACNLCCSYCYQTSISPEKKSICIDTDKVIEFMSKAIEDENYEELDICFIGGEPLLYCNQIIEISNLINLKFSNTKSIKYSLVTNGTLLKPDKLELLLKNKIDSFQITIDGMEKVHDALRKDITGKGSFTEIIENILYIQKYYETVNISINCNINSKNLNDISNFLKYIKTSKIKYPIFFSLIFDNGINSKLEVDDASLNWLKVHKEAIRYGYKFEPFYRDLFLGCAMTQRNYHIIGADGFLYKCINAVENPEYLLTKLSKYKTREYEKKLNHFLNYKIDNVECEDCQFYPVCYGGCKYMNELNGFNCNKKMFNEIETNIIREIVNARNN